MNDLQVFRNPEFGEIRATVIDGMTWAVGKDVAKALGYKNTKEAIACHVDAEDKMGSQNTTPSILDSMGRKQHPIWINESGLYSLILSSKLPAAKAFKHWVTSEVLPSIRRTGGYSPDRPQSDAGETLALMRELMDARAENAALRLKIAQDEITALRRQIKGVQAGPDRVAANELERRRDQDRERQRRYRERKKLAGQAPDT